MYKVTITDYAEKQFKKINRQYWPKIMEAVFALANEPRPNGYKKLKGREAYRIRIGDYRVIV
jgi:mRNA interferase RelE/StbE